MKGRGSGGEIAEWYVCMYVRSRYIYFAGMYVKHQMKIRYLYSEIR